MRRKAVLKMIEELFDALLAEHGPIIDLADSPWSAWIQSQGTRAATPTAWVSPTPACWTSAPAMSPSTRKAKARSPCIPWTSWVGSSSTSCPTASTRQGPRAHQRRAYPLHPLRCPHPADPPGPRPATVGPMCIGPTAVRKCIQAPPELGEAKPCTTEGVKTFEESADLKAGSPHTCRVTQPSLRKRTPGAISA